MKRLLALIALAAIAIAAYALPTTTAPSVVLSWDASTDTSVVGYRVYWGAATRSYTNFVEVTGRSNTTATVTGLARGVTYYFAATSLATAGLESGYSAEVTYTTAPLPAIPTGLSVRTGSP